MSQPPSGGERIGNEQRHRQGLIHSVIRAEGRSADSSKELTEETRNGRAAHAPTVVQGHTAPHLVLTAASLSILSSALGLQAWELALMFSL